MKSNKKNSQTNSTQEQEPASDSQHLELHGTVTEAGRGIFRILVDNSQEHIVKATVSGKMKKFKIMVVVGDRVMVKVSPYDLNTGFICKRL